MKSIKRQSDESRLEKAVRVIVNRHAEAYNGSGVEGFMKDLMYGGCQSGMIGELVYYRDTCAFYKRHQADINSLLQETLSESGARGPSDLFGEKWDSEDPLALDDLNQNLLAWFAFEETARSLASRAGIDV